MKKDFFKNKKVFISGGAGVIGSELVELLHARGAKLLVGDLKPRPRDWPQNIAYRQGDLNFISKRELDAFGPELFFHLAASFERSVESYEFWDEQWRNNAQLSHHLMTLLKDSDTLRSIVFASSYLVYDKSLYMFNEPQGEPRRLEESDPVAPRNMTGSSKLNHEVELAFIGQFKKMQVVCARIYRSYGKNSRDVISRWVRLLLTGKPIDLYHPENLFDYIYAGNVAEGLMRLAQSGTSGIVNLGSGRARRVEDAVEALREHFPTLATRNLPSADAFEASEADTRLLRSLAGWEPPVSLEEGIVEVVKFEKSRALEPMAGPYNVLVASAAKKIPLLRAVRAAMEKIGGAGTLHGGDVEKEALAKHFVDKFWVMPKTNDKFFRNILSYLKKENIRVVIPTRDGELPFWSKHKEALAREGIAVMVSGPRAIELTLDKLRFGQWGKKHVFPIIPTAATIDGVRSVHYVVKERFGAGSKSLGLNLIKTEALEHAKKLEAPIFQPLINGREYSVDVYVGSGGRAKGAVVRERNIVVDGESQVTTVVQDKKMEQTCIRIAEKLGLRGNSVFQVFRDAKKKMHIIECNARFGGASTSSIAAGLDSFYWFLLEAAGADISGYPFVPARKLTMVRFKEDLFLP